MKRGDLVSFKYAEDSDPEYGIIMAILPGYREPLLEIYFFNQRRTLCYWASAVKVISQ